MCVQLYFCLISCDIVFFACERAFLVALKYDKTLLISEFIKQKHFKSQSKNKSNFGTQHIFPLKKTHIFNLKLKKTFQCQKTKLEQY